MRHPWRFRPPKNLFDFLLVAAGFTLALSLYSTFLSGGMDFPELLGGSAVSTLTFWVAIQFEDADPDAENPMTSFLAPFCLGTGANLLLHALLTYAFFMRRTPFLIAIGGALASLFLAAGRRWIYAKELPDSSVLLLGFDSVARLVAGSLGRPIMGVVGSNAAPLPEGVALLGETARFQEIVDKYRPTHLVVSDDEGVAPSALLKCRLSGIVVEASPAVYERLFQRVSCGRLQPMELLLSSSLRGDSRTMAIQAVYTNLLGLFFLVTLAPVLAMASLAVAAFSGPGPTFETVECAGFQYIPFRLLRFRTRRRDGSGSATRIGRVLTKLHLVDLPQLINVVRGEMALVGPRPVRRQFAVRMTELMPFYSHRFSVKPGIFGWAQMHADDGAGEFLQIEYDLYYIKEGSPWLDAQILVDMMLGGWIRRREPAGQPGVLAAGVR